MSKTDERRWLWWVLGVLVLGLAASFFLFQRPAAGPTTIGGSGVELRRTPFPKGGMLPEIPQRGHLQPGRLPPDPKLDRGQSK